MDAIRTFIQPCLTYALRTGTPTLQSLKSYRSKLLSVVRNICNVPTRSTTHYFFASRQAGGLGLQDPFTERDIQMVVQCIKMLSSNDPTIAGVARAELNKHVREATQSTATPELVSHYLSHLPDRRLDNVRHGAPNLWNNASRSANRLDVHITLPEMGPATLSTPEYVEPIAAKDTCRFLHNLTKSQAANALRDLRDQGKVARSLNQDKHANGSMWHYTGLNMRFKDWRFIHKARLNLLPTNAVKVRFSAQSSQCRQCIDQETLPHVLNHCTNNMPAITARHNRVVTRLVNSVRSGSITTDKTVSDSGSNVRPDIVIVDNDKATIIDVCCPFDNGPDALEEAVNLKEQKYHHLKDFFESKGTPCEVFGFAVGSLGSWFPGNERVLNRLAMSRRYKNLFRKLCVTDVIQGSCDIYRQHLGCDSVDGPLSTPQ